MAPIEDAQTYARLFLETWRAALELQYKRVRDLTEVSREITETMDWRVIEPDCSLLVLALQQAIVSVETVAHFEGGEIKDAVEWAMEEMNKRHGGLKDLKDLRDMLTHFDKYLKGEGHLQPGGRLHRQRQAIPDQDPDRDFDMHRKWRYDPHSHQVVLRVRAMGKSVEVLSMSRLVMALIDVVQTGIDEAQNIL